MCWWYIPVPFEHGLLPLHTGDTALAAAAACPWAEALILLEAALHCMTSLPPAISQYSIALGPSQKLPKKQRCPNAVFVDQAAANIALLCFLCWQTVNVVTVTWGWPHRISARQGSSQPSHFRAHPSAPLSQSLLVRPPHRTRHPPRQRLLLLVRLHHRQRPCLPPHWPCAPPP